jgi:hypothetical protein
VRGGEPEASGRRGRANAEVSAEVRQGLDTLLAHLYLDTEQFAALESLARSPNQCHTEQLVRVLRDGRERERERKGSGFPD